MIPLWAAIVAGAGLGFGVGALAITVRLTRDIVHLDTRVRHLEAQQ